MDEYLQALERVKKHEEVSNADLEAVLLQTYRLLDDSNETTYNLCLAAICHVANMHPGDTMVQQLLHDCIIKSRVFLYDDLLKKNLPDFSPHISPQDTLAKSFYTSQTTGTTLTRQQKEIFNLFQEFRRIIISAPTSFGKTRIISEIIAHNDYRHIALIMPTVSLLSEQYQTLKETVRGYTISRSSKVSVDSDGKYLLILTPERINIFMEDNPDFQFDFFVMDEVYKVDYKLDDDRFRVFSDALYQLAKSSADFYLIGPYITDFSQKFRERFGATIRIYNTEIVQKDYYSLDNQSSRGVHEIEGSAIRIIGNKSKNLLRILTNDAIDGKFLIYRYQKQYVEAQAQSLLETWPQQPHDTHLVEYLSSMVSPDWDLIACIKRGVAFHHGGMPRHIQDLIVDAFNDDANGVNYLFCTTSLTEGVNTSAKNVILYDKKIGAGDDLQTLDKKNIEGRAGRFMRHFVGRVFYLEDPADSEEDVIVEIEGFDSENPSIEALLQMDIQDISDTNARKTTETRKKLDSLSIPYELIKSNKYISVDGQIRLIQLFREHADARLACQFDGTLPDGDTISHILSTVYELLFTERNKGRYFQNEVGKAKLIGLTKYYLYHHPTFAQLLSSSTVQATSQSTSTRIRFTFDLISKYFEFTWPRYIKAFERLFNFVANEHAEVPINLEMTIATLEYGTANPHEILLKDSGLPTEIIKKISPFFTECTTFDDIQNIANAHRSEITSNLHPVEVRLVNKYL